jgi:hypothetical protein
LPKETHASTNVRSTGDIGRYGDWGYPRSARTVSLDPRRETDRPKMPLWYVGED